MPDKMTAICKVSINAPIATVWDALTNPKLIKQYMFGTNTITDWQVGSTITYQGIWNDKPYEDKGSIEAIETEKLLHTTFYSNMSGQEDIPENYANIIYKVAPIDNGTELIVTQDNIDGEKALEYMNKNWALILDGLKKLLEK